MPAYEDYPPRSAQIIPRLRPGDAIIFTPDEVRIPAEFYLRSVTTKLDLIPLFPPDPWGQFKTGEQRVVDFGRATVTAADPTRYPRVWLIAFRVHTTLKPRIRSAAIAVSGDAGGEDREPVVVRADRVLERAGAGDEREVGESVGRRLGCGARDRAGAVHQLEEDRVGRLRGACRPPNP